MTPVPATPRYNQYQAVFFNFVLLKKIGLGPRLYTVMCVGIILLTCMQLLIVHVTNNPTVPFMALFGLSLSSAPLDQQSNYNN